MQWAKTDEDLDGVLRFAYDGGVMTDSTIQRFRLPPEELRSYRFVEPSAVPTLASAETSARVAATIAALAHNTFIELPH